MTVYSPANADELQAAFTAATGGDTIELGNVIYDNGVTNKNSPRMLQRNNKTFTGSGLLIKSADPHNRAVINNYAARLNGIKGLHFEDVDFVGTLDEPASDSKGWPVPTPAVAPAIVLDNAGAVLCADISFDRCLFDYFNTVMNIQAAADDLVVQNCNFRRIGEDGWRALHGGARWVFYRNSFADDRVNGLRFEDNTRHPDWIQWGVDDADSVQYTDALIAENHFVGSYTKPIYISKGGAADTGPGAIPAAWGGVRHLRHVVRDNWLYASRMLTIHLEDGKDVEILRNTIIEAPPGVGNVKEGPQISLQGRIESITIQNNLMPDTIRTSGVTYVGTNVLTRTRSPRAGARPARRNSSSGRTAASRPRSRARRARRSRPAARAPAMAGSRPASGTSHPRGGTPARSSSATRRLPMPQPRCSGRWARAPASWRPASPPRPRRAARASDGGRWMSRATCSRSGAAGSLPA